jgi:hypothetical protein
LEVRGDDRRTGWKGGKTGLQKVTFFGRRMGFRGCLNVHKSRSGNHPDSPHCAQDH